MVLPLASEAEIVVGSLGYFVIVGVLLGMAGVPGVSIQLPDPKTGFGDDLGARVDCWDWAQWFCNIGSGTINLIEGVYDVATYVIAFVFFFFQLLTYQLPIPPWLNSIIVLPPAIAMIYIGMRFTRGGG